MAEASNRSGVFADDSTCASVVAFVHPQLRRWLDTHHRLLAMLTQRP